MQARISTQIKVVEHQNTQDWTISASEEVPESRDNKSSCLIIFDLILHSLYTINFWGFEVLKNLSDEISGIMV